MSTTLTLDQILDEASGITGLDVTTSSIERTYLVGNANEAVREVLLKTHCYVTTLSQSIVAGTSDYTLSSGLLALNDIDVPSDPSPRDIVITSSREVLLRRRGTVTDVPRYAAIQGNNLLLVAPTPSANETWTLYAVPLPTEMADAGRGSSGNDCLTTTYGGLPVYSTAAVQAYVNARGFEKSHDYQAAQYWDQQFESECAKIRKRDRGKLNRRPPMPVIGYPGRPNWGPHRNDVYPEY